MPPGVTGRSGFVDAPALAADLARGYRTAGNRIAIVTDDPRDLIEVPPPSRGPADLGGVTVERCPPRPAIGE